MTGPLWSSSVGKPRMCLENNTRLLSGSTHSVRSAPTHARAHTQPENVHRSGLTGLLVLTQTQDEASEERRDGTRLPLLTQQRRCLRSLLQHLAQQK